MAVKPNMNVKDTDIYKMLWGLKGATRGIQLLGLLMSRADPSALQGCPLFSSRFLQISNKSQISSRRKKTTTVMRKVC